MLPLLGPPNNGAVSPRLKKHISLFLRTHERERTYENNGYFYYTLHLRRYDLV
jgi:hypothetical protein